MTPLKGLDKNGASSMTITGPYDQNWDFLVKLSERLKIKSGLDRDRFLNKEGKINSRSVFKITNACGNKLFMDYIYKNVENDNIGLKRKRKKWLEFVEFAKTRDKIKEYFLPVETTYFDE